MAAQPKTQQHKQLITRTVSEEQLLDMVATGWSQRRIADHVSQLVGQPVSQYYVCKTLQTFGDRYQEAKKAQAEYHAERIADLADKVEDGKIDSSSARVASDNRKWLASKLDPSTYSDKAQLDIAVTDVTALHLAALRDRLKTVVTQTE
jgi:hypothetical protein